MIEIKRKKYFIVVLLNRKVLFMQYFLKIDNNYISVLNFTLFYILKILTRFGFIRSFKK